MIRDYTNNPYVKSREEAFKLARKELGVKKKFIYNGITYYTDLAEDVASSLYEHIPDNPDKKYKIDHLKNILFEWDGVDWMEMTKTKDGFAPLKSINSFKKNNKDLSIDLNKDKITREVLLNALLNDKDLYLMIEDKFPEVLTLAGQGKYDEAVEYFLDKNPQYRNSVSGDVSQSQVEEQIQSRNTIELDDRPLYNSFQPFVWYGKMDMNGFDEFSLSEQEYKEKDGISRHSGVYYLIKMIDETEDPNDPNVQIEAVDDDEALNKLLNVPNNFLEAQNLYMVKEFDEAVELYDKGYRLLDAEGNIQAGYVEHQSKLEIFSVSTLRQPWSTKDAFAEDWNEGGYIELLPFVGSMKVFTELMYVYDILQRVGEAQETDDYTTISDGDWMVLKQHYERGLRDSEWGTMVYEGIAHSLGFAIEIAFSGGLTKSVQELTEKGIKKGVKWLSSKHGKKILDSQLGKMSTKMTSHFVGNAVARPSLLMLPRTAKGTIERMIPNYVVGENRNGELTAKVLEDGMGFGDAVKWSWIETQIEVLSEQFGEWILGISPQAKEVVARMGFMKLFKEMNPNLSESQMLDVLNKYGYHGVGMEMIEEEVGRGARGIIHYFDDQDKSFEYKLPSWKELSATFTSFLLSPQSVGLTGYNWIANYENVKVANTVKGFTDKKSSSYIKGFRKKSSVKEVEKAVKKDIIDVNTGNYIKLIIARLEENGLDFDTTSIIKIHKNAKFVFREQKIKEIMDEKGISKKEAEREWEEWLEGEGETKDGLMAQVLGRTSIIDVKEGYSKVLLDLYAGHDKETIIEEFLGVYFKTMPQEDYENYIKIYKGTSTKLTEQEWFEKNGVDYIMQTSEFGHSGLVKIIENAKNMLGHLMGSSDNIYELPDGIKDMYNKIFKSKEKIELEEKKDVKEVKNVNINDKDESYNIVVPTKEVAVKLAYKSILDPENLQDKKLKNKIVNRGVLMGFKDIINAVEEGRVDIDEAKGWYNQEIDGTFDIMKEEIPELALDITGATEIFAKVVLAITSNGQKVRTNYNQAVELVKDYIANGKFTEGQHTYFNPKTKQDVNKPAFYITDTFGDTKLVGGTRFSNIRQSLMMVDSLVKEYGMEGAMRFLLEKQVGSEIGEKLGYGSAITKTKLHYGAERLGKKIGAFFLNMNGISELPTYDQWWSRTWNRWMGTPLTQAGNLQDTPRNDSERSAMSMVLNRIADRLTDSKDLNPSGDRIKPEDVQALLWYYEKDLYINAGATPSDLVSFKGVAEERLKVINAQQTSTSTDSKESNKIENLRLVGQGKQTESPESIKARADRLREGLRKGTSYQIKAFHGTNTTEIKKFDPDKGSQNRVGLAQGWGVYFTSEEELATYYAHLKESMHGDNDTKPTVYQVLIHKGKTPNEYDYLEFGNSPSDEQSLKILTKLNEILTPDEMTSILSLYSSMRSGKPQPYRGYVYSVENEHSMMDMEGSWSGQDIYDAIASIFAERILLSERATTRDEERVKSIKEKAQKITSAMLLEAGIDGIKFNTYQENEGGSNKATGWVVFDPNEITIEKYKSDVADNSRLNESFRIKTIKEKIELKPETIKDWLYQKLVDKYHRMKMVQESFGYVSEDVDVYLKMIKHPGKTKYKLSQIEDKAKKLVDRVVKAGFTLEQFEEYLYSLHAVSRNEFIKKNRNPDNDSGSGMTDKEALEIREKYDGTKLEVIAKAFHKQITNARLELLKKSGLITLEQYEQYKNQWDNYVPLKKETLINRFIQSVRSGFNVQGADIHRAGGMTSRARNVFLSAIADYQETTRRVEQQEILKTLAKLIRKNPSKIWKIKRPKYVKKTPIWDDDGNFEYIGQERLADNEIGFREVGKDGKVKQFVIEINDQSTLVKDKFGTVIRNPLLTSLTNIGVEKGFHILNKMNTFLRRNYTTWNPDFIVSNFERDIQTAFYNLNIDYDPKVALLIMNDVRKALVGIYKNTRGYKKSGIFGNEWKNIYEDYKRNGGQMGWFDSKSIEDKMQEIQKNIYRHNKQGNTRKAISYMVQWIEDMNETVEQGVRLATYKRMIELGMSKSKAVAVAKDLTINFNRKGEWGSMINSAYLFFNAGVQGAVNVGSRAINSPTGNALASGLFGLGMLNTFINKQICPKYNEEISAYEKDNYWIFMNGNCEIGFKLRMPYGWGMFKAVGGILYDYNDGSIDLDEAVTRIFISADHSFNPVGGGTVLQSLAPTIIDPLVMSFEGKDFKGDDIYPHEFSQNKTPDFKKHKKYTSDLYVDGAKWISDATGGNDYQGGLVDVSPETYKIWTNFIGGGAFSNMQRTFSTGKSLIFDARLPRVRNDESIINWNEVPIFRQHIVQKKDYLYAKDVFKMFNNADIKLYNPNEFDAKLREAVKHGDISLEKAYGSKGVDVDGDGWIDKSSAGMYNTFKQRQIKLYQNLQK